VYDPDRRQLGKHTAQASKAALISTVRRKMAYIVNVFSTLDDPHQVIKTLHSL